MSFPKWAPNDLVDFYLSLEEYDYEEVKEHKEIVHRLITRPEMEKIWQSYDNRQTFFKKPASSRAGIVGSLLRAYDEFNSFAKATPSERLQDYKELKKLRS